MLLTQLLIYTLFYVCTQSQESLLFSSSSKDLYLPGMGKPPSGHVRQAISRLRLSELSTSAGDTRKKIEQRTKASVRFSDSAR